MAIGGCKVLVGNERLLLVVAKYVCVCVCFSTFSGQKCPDFVGKPEKNSTFYTHFVQYLLHISLFEKDK